MRRLLASVAALAGVLLAPSAALAVGQPVITVPATATSATRTLPITISWSEVGGRSVLPRLPGRPELHQQRIERQRRLARRADSHFVDTTALAEGTYCYYVQAQDLIFGTQAIQPPSW